MDQSEIILELQKEVSELKARIADDANKRAMEAHINPKKSSRAASIDMEDYNVKQVAYSDQNMTYRDASDLAKTIGMQKALEEPERDNGNLTVSVRLR